MLAERMELLTKRPRGTLFPPAQNRAAWEALPANDRMDMETFIAKWRGTPYPMLLLSDYAAFVRTGSRAQCETPYFARRRKLIAAVLDVCLHGESADLSPVEDGLWCICEETTWAISAHANLTAPVSYQRRADTGLVRRADCHGAVLYADAAGRLA